MISNLEGKPKRALGRGLSALIPSDEPPDDKTTVLQVSVDEILPDELQPRKTFDQTKIDELAASIRAQGVLQPLLVRREGSLYRLIAGERRWRAAREAGLSKVPVLVREATASLAFELALVENLQRADLNPIEEAEAYQRLIDEFHLTQEQVSEQVGKDRSSISNALRLLTLPDEVKAMLASGALSMGQARAILGVADPAEMIRLAQEIADERMSVRQTERLVKERKRTHGKRGEKTGGANNRPDIRALVEDLQRRLGTRVKLNDREGVGSLEIEYFSYEDLDRIFDLLRK